MSLVDFLGPDNQNIRQLAAAFPGSKIISRGNEIKIQGQTEVISRINDMSTTDGLFAEGLLAAAVQTNPDIRDRLEAFFTKKTKRLEPGAS